MIRAQKLGCTPKKRKISCITVPRKGLLLQLVAQAVDCWFKYSQERSIGQKKEKNKEKAVGKESTKRN